MLLHQRHYARVLRPARRDRLNISLAVPPESWSCPSPSQVPDPAGAGAASGPGVAECASDAEGPSGVANCPASGGPIQYRCRVHT